MLRTSKYSVILLCGVSWKLSLSHCPTTVMNRPLLDPFFLHDFPFMNVGRTAPLYFPSFSISPWLCFPPCLMHCCFFYYSRSICYKLLSGVKTRGAVPTSVTSINFLYILISQNKPLSKRLHCIIFHFLELHLKISILWNSLPLSTSHPLCRPLPWICVAEDNTRFEMVKVTFQGLADLFLSVGWQWNCSDGLSW